MKVLDLQCFNLHRFEGWFGSEAEFQSQWAAGLVSCPLCGCTDVQKLLSAPRLSLSGAVAPSEVTPHGASAAAMPQTHTDQQTPVDAREPAGASVAAMQEGIASNPALQALFVRAVREIMRQTEDVGDQFADQARRMHHGEQAGKAIRGQATRAETQALLEEGIDIMPLPHLPGLKETLQ